MEAGISVLYVDDEPGLLEITKIFLEGAGNFQVSTSLSAKKALDSPALPLYDLILSDYLMPEMDGIAFLKEVRKRYGDIPFILFTGRGREEVVIAAINNGADFYLQKGGDPTAQFAELAHKIRQAVARKRAEHSLIESEKRLTDIINFLPDATFAIDRAGTVIAWNHAIVDMTGIPAADMLGKGDHEYAVPFYGTRRKILIDLIFESDDAIARDYTHIFHEKDILIADTTLPRPRGKTVTLMGKASPLYDREGTIVGAIESIRDITKHEMAAEQVTKKTKTLSVINRIIQSTNLQQTVDDSIPTVLSSVLDLFHYDAGGVYLVDDDRKTARIVCQENLDPAFVREIDNIDIRARPYDALFIRGEAVILDNFGSILPHAAAVSGLCSVASIPIVSQDTVIGALNVASRQRAVISDDDREILIAIGKELGSAITRIKAEASLRESEEKYRSLVNLVPDAVIVHRDGVVVYVNPECARLFGAEDPEDLIGRNILPYIHPDDRPMALEHLRLMKENGVTIPLVEERLLRPDGRPFTVEITAKPVVYLGLPSVIVVFRDITERKKREDELRAAYEQITAAEEEMRDQFGELARAERLVRESEEKFRSIFEKSHDAFLIFSDGKCSDCNQSALDLFGYSSREEIAGLTPLDLSPPVQQDGRDTASAADVHFHAVAEHGSRQVVWTHTKKDGSTFIADILLSAYELAEKQVVVSSIRDITDRMKMEEELQLLKISVDEAFDEVFWLDFSGNFLYVNDAACRNTGYTANEFRAMKISTLSPDLLPGIWEKVVADLRERKKLYTVTRHRCKDGRIIDVEIVAVYVNKDKREYSFAFVRDITERKRTERTLQESEARSRKILEEVPLPLALVGNDGKLNFINDRFVRIFGYTLEDIPTLETWWHLAYPDPEYRQCVIRQWEEAVRHAGEAHADIMPAEYRVTGKNGEERIIEISGITLGDGFLAMFIDHTGQKRMEESLRESEARLTSMLHGSPVLQFVLGGDHRILSWNKALEEYSGIPAAVVMGTDQQWRPFYPHQRPVLADLLVDNNTDGLFKWYAGKLRPSRYVEGAYEATDFFPSMGASGTWLFFTAAPIRNADGTIIGAVETLEDVTGRVAATDALRASEEKYRRILENMQDAYIRTSENGIVTMVNPSAVRLYGYASADEMIGIPAASLYAIPGQREGMLLKLQKAGGVTDFAGVALRKDGTTFQVSLNVQVIRNEEGCVLGTEGIVRDITESKSMEHAIREANRKLNLLNSITRHDVMNQLTLLQGFTRVAAMKERDPAIAGFLAKIDAASATIRRQIEFMKTYHELGVHAPGWSLLRETVGKAAREEVAFSDTCGDIEVLADPMLEKVFYNLFENAIRHGEHVTEITVRCERVPGGLAVVVEDNGIGVLPEEKEKIFEKGFGKHSGFGLFLAREILSITGITIRENGTPGKGAMFEILVPEGQFRAAQK